MIGTADPIIEKVRAYNGAVDPRRLARAFEFGKVAHDGQIRASGEPYFTHPVAAEKHYPTLPWRSPWATSGWYSCPPPMLGQHNAEVLGALGLGEAELADLESRGIISSRLG